MLQLPVLWLNMNRQMKRIDPNLPRSSGEVRIAQELDGIAQMEERAEQDPDAPKQ